MTCLTCFTDLNVLVVDVRNLTDCRFAIKVNKSYFAGRKSYLSHAVFFRHKLSCASRTANELTALACVKFNVVDKCTYRNLFYGERVAGLDVGFCSGIYHVAIRKTYGSDDILLFAAFILNESDISSAVGVIFNAYNLCCAFKIIALEVDYSVFLLVAAAVMTDGYLAVAVSAGMFFLNRKKALLGSELCDFRKIRNRHSSSAGSRRIIFYCCHFRCSSSLDHSVEECYRL